MKRLDETSLRFLMLGAGAVSALAGQSLLTGPELGYAPADRVQLQTFLETSLDALIDSYVVLNQDAQQRGGPSIRVSVGGQFISFYERLPLPHRFNSVYERAGPLVLRSRLDKPYPLQNGRSLSLADALEQVSTAARSGLTIFLQSELHHLLGRLDGGKSLAGTNAGLVSESYSPIDLSGRLDPVDLLLRQGYRLHPLFEHPQTAVRVLVDEMDTPCYAVFQPESLEARFFIDLRFIHKRGTISELLAGIAPTSAHQQQLMGDLLLGGEVLPPMKSLPGFFMSNPQALRELIWDQLHPLSCPELYEGKVIPGCFWGQVLTTQPVSSLSESPVLAQFPPSTIVFPLIDSLSIRQAFVQQRDTLRVPADCLQALWMSNTPVTLLEEVAMKQGGMLAAGSVAYLHKGAGRYRVCSETGQYSEPLLKRPKVSLRPIRRIVLVEHPSEAFAYHCLFVARSDVDINRREAQLFISVAPESTPEQQQRLEKLLVQHPGVGIVVATSVRSESISSSMRLLSLRHPQEASTDALRLGVAVEGEQLRIRYEQPGESADRLLPLFEEFRSFVRSPLPAIVRQLIHDPDTDKERTMTLLESQFPYTKLLATRALNQAVALRNAAIGRQAFEIITPPHQQDTFSGPYQKTPSLAMG